MEQKVLALLHAAQQERKAGPGPGGHDLSGGRPEDAADQGAVGRRRGGQAAPAVRGPLPCGCGRRPQHTHADPPGAVQMQSDGQRRPAQALLASDGPGPSPGPVTDPGKGVRGGALEQLLNARRSATGHTTWCCGRATPRRLTRGSREVVDSWEPAEHLAKCP